MKKIKKITLALGAFATVAAPIATVISCGNTSPYDYENFGLSKIDKNFIKNKSEHKNVMSTYSNTTDMLAALGRRPDFVTIKKIGQNGSSVLYPNYLKPFLGENNGASTNAGHTNNTNRYEIKTGVTVFDGKPLDREEIANNDISTMLLNEWYKVDENKMTDIIPALIYTSMGDGHASYEEPYTTSNHSWKQFDVFEAFRMLANGLDAGYQGNHFEEVANKINSEVKNNITKAANALPDTVKGKKLFVLDADYDSKADKVNYTARTPGVYTMLYSKNKEMGLGFDFPTATSTTNLTFGEFSVKGNDTASFLEAYKNTTDEIIVLNKEYKDDQSIQKIKNNAEKDLGILLANNQDLNKHIHVVDINDYYLNVWGIIGSNEFLKNISTLFGSPYQSNAISEFDEAKEELTTLR